MSHSDVAARAPKAVTLKNGGCGTLLAALDARMSSVVHRLTVVILAAGEGKRMRSRQPKVLHPLCGRPLIAYPLRAAHALADRFVVVAPPETPALREALPADIRVVEQRERLGTGHAVLQAKAECGDGTILVLPADMPPTP